MIYIFKSIFNKFLRTKPLHTYIQLSKAIAQQIEQRIAQFSIQYALKSDEELEQDVNNAIEFLDISSPYSYRNFASSSYTYTKQDHAITLHFTITFETSEAEEAFVKAELQRIATSILRKKQSDLDIVKAVNDYIVLNFSYNLETKRSPYSVHTLLVEKQGVCQAMALFSFKLFNILGIPCFYVTGFGDEERHGWNLVQLNGFWYHLDTTWNNPNFGEHMFENYRINYQYFLLTDEQISVDHTFDKLHYPPANSERFNAFHQIAESVQIGDILYFSNKVHNDLLYKMNLKDPMLQLTQILNVRVQFLSYYKDTLYFSNYSDSGYLYSYNTVDSTLKLLSNYEITNARVTNTSLYIQNTLADIICIPLDRKKGE